MRTNAILALLAATQVSAGSLGRHRRSAQSDVVRRQDNSTAEGPNPFEGRKVFANPGWAQKLEVTVAAFEARGDTENAAKTRQVQKTGTFVWVTSIGGLSSIDTAIAQARAEQEATGVEQIVGLVLYNLPDRDCSAGESAGELSSAEGGMERYKTEFIAPYAAKVSAATDLTFAIVLEPDSLANSITNQGIPFCAQATPVYEEGIAHAIASLQFPNVHLYLDAAHGGWLGWADNLPLTAAEFAKVLALAGSNAKVRGFSTNVSNYNPFRATVRENYTEWSPSWDEDHYVLSLSPFLEEEGLPSRFIIDQSRVHLPGARAEWGEWCNVAPAAFGLVPGAPVDNPHVDSIVWVKPPGESDGRCGMTGAPAAGRWFDAYVQMLVQNADPSLIGDGGEEEPEPTSTVEPTPTATETSTPEPTTSEEPSVTPEPTPEPTPTEEPGCAAKARRSHS